MPSLQIAIPLSVTRRCLQDGHFYCSGETDRPNLKKKKKRKGLSCSSEFDYIGWREWGEWKRRTLSNLENGGERKACAKDCQKCEFPSQCRYASTRTTAEKGAVNEKINEVAASAPTMDEDSAPSFQPNEVEKSHFHVSESVTFDSIFAPVATEQSRPSDLEDADHPSNKDTDVDTSSTNTSFVKSTSAALGRGVKIAGRRSTKKSALSPIAEEFFCRPDFTILSSSDLTLQPLKNVIETTPSVAGEDWMDLS